MTQQMLILIVFIGGFAAGVIVSMFFVALFGDNPK
jgi:hypothetical protein